MESPEGPTIEAPAPVRIEPDSDRPFEYLLVKLAARCNIDCDYCYWFRDESVYRLPKLLPEALEAHLVAKVSAHVLAHDLDAFSVIFHGGEPLLFGKRRFQALCERFDAESARIGRRLNLSLVTNGLLVDDEWIALFKAHDVRLTLSLDGAKAQHDAHRVDFKGAGTWDRVVATLKRLEAADMQPGILAVCDPKTDPAELYAAFVDQLGLKGFDVLIPDATHDDAAVEPIAAYYNRLFDLWFDHYHQHGVEVRILDNMVRGAFGQPSSTESIGYGPVSTVSMLTDGSLEPLDVLRIAGGRDHHSPVHIATHAIQDVAQDAAWREAQSASLNLCATCQACPLKNPCGGGYLPSRWSTARRYDNPTVYCDDIKAIFAHIHARVAPTLAVA